ncbi:hypothetical protein K458DRAFT_446566 [Lentithecium fluviatile CBS 122367]|uniref:Uncharacterized protein n=1 Tax=Lentithecium fluviatile CBS 122367 TaxID=1168545 RepID=A0A6G1IJG7_9PLEO|nr:hypothetical protein K458DRAFT_446566 [Lentithecium fluviatile CBS 122367]
MTIEKFPEYLKTHKVVNKYDPSKGPKLPHPWREMDKAEALDGMPENDKELDHLFRTANTLAKVERSPAIKVALVGFSADGAACTSAVIGYAHFPGGEEDEDVKFFARIELLNAEKREEIKEHARPFHYYHDEDDDSEDEDAPRSKKCGCDESDRCAKDTAEDVFVTLFGSMEKCETAIAKLDRKSEGIAQFCRKDQKDLIKKISPVLTKVKGRISFQHNLLEQGLELVDVPVRHAKEVKVFDVELIFGDTIRIASNDSVINNARAAATVRGATSVKLVATKIDPISPNQLDQCTGLPYDQIKEMIQITEAEENRADAEEDWVVDDIFSKHQIYLKRHLVQVKVFDRSKHIDEELATKFPSRSPADNPEVFHASASNHMDWIKKPELRFNEQPPLSPHLTGLPGIRRFLRIVADTDRDTRFRDLTEAFDGIRQEFIKQLRSQTKSTFEDLSKNGVAKTQADTDVYKHLVDKRLRKQWVALPGVIPKGASKARDLQEGCNWNQEITDILAPGLNKWFLYHTKCMKTIALALRQALDHAHQQTIRMMEKSPANLVVEKAKKKWEDFRPKMKAKLSVLMSNIDRLERRSVLWATMQNRRENNLVAKITTSKYKGKTRYFTPRIAFQKEFFLKLTIRADTHLVDDLISRFQKEFDRALDNVLDEHFEDMDKLLEGFSEMLRNQPTVDYTITPLGEDMRKRLEGSPFLLRRDASAEDTGETVGELFDRISKRRWAGGPNTQRVRIKEN